MKTEGQMFLVESVYKICIAKTHDLSPPPISELNYYITHYRDA